VELACEPHWGPVITGLINAYKAKLDAANTQDRIAADLAAKEIEAEIAARKEASAIIIAIDLVYYHGKSIREVADITHTSEATVKTRMFYARKNLGELIRHAIHYTASANAVSVSAARRCPIMPARLSLRHRWHGMEVT
jgi:Sigma-70, region 4